MLFEDLETPTPTKPVKPTSTDEVDVDLYKEEVKMYAQEKKNIQSTLRSIFNVVWGQCSTIMKSKLESKTNFKTSKQNKDVAELLKQIKAIMHQFESHTSIYEALDEAKRNFYLYYQSPLTSNVQHVKNLQDMVDIIEYHGGSVTEDRALFEHEKKLEANLPTTEKSSEETLKQRARDKMLGVALIRRADRGRYSKLMTDLKDQYTLKSDVYPDDIASAHNMLENYSSRQRKNNNKQQKTEGLQFAQSSEVISGKDGKIFENIQCHKCKKKGHYANQCPQKQEGIQLLMTTLEVCKETGKIPQDGNNLHFSFLHQDKYKKTKISETSILIGTGSTVSVFKNRKLLKTSKQVRAHCAPTPMEGTKIQVFRATLQVFFHVWYNPSSMVNILAWCDVRKKFRITTDTNIETTINVHINKNHIIKFREVESGLYIYNTENTLRNNNTPLGHSFLNLTTENMSNFTNSQIRQAERAKKLYTAIGMPSYDKYMDLLNKNSIKNCPVTVDDVKRALFIWGPEVATIKGKTTRINPKHTPSTVTLPLPKTTQDFHSSVTLCVDFLCEWRATITYYLKVI